MSSNLASNVSYQTALRLRSVHGLQDALTSTKNPGATLWKKNYVLGPSYVVMDSFVDNDSSSTTFDYGNTYKFTLPASIDFILQCFMYLHVGRSYQTSHSTYYTAQANTTTPATVPGGTNRGYSGAFSTDAMSNLFTDSKTEQFINNDDDDATDRDISYLRAAEDFGRSLWEEAYFTIAGNTTIQTIHSMYDHIKESLDADSNLMHPALTGRTGDGQGDLATLSKIPHFNQLFYVPMSSAFTEKEEFLPLIGLYLTTPKIEIKFRKKSELVFEHTENVTKAKDSLKLNAAWNVAACLNNAAHVVMPIMDCRLLIRHLLVDQEFRKKWGKKPQSYFIQEIRDTETAVAAGATPNFFDIDLSDSHNMCSELIMVFRSDANVQAGHYYDFSGNENSVSGTAYSKPGVDSFEAFASLQPFLGTNAITPELPATYWRILMPSMHHQKIPAELIYTVPFYMPEQKDMSNYKGHQNVIVKNAHNLSRLSNFKIRVHKNSDSTTLWTSGTLHTIQIIRNLLTLKAGSISKRWGN